MDGRHTGCSSPVTTIGPSPSRARAPAWPPPPTILTPSGAGASWRGPKSGPGLPTRQSCQRGRARVAAAGVPDPFAEGWARVAEIEAAITTESPTAADHVAGYAEWAAEVGAPSLLSRAALYQGSLYMVVEPSCPAEALASYRTGLDLARRAGDTNNEGEEPARRDLGHRRPPERRSARDRARGAGSPSTTPGTGRWSGWRSRPSQGGGSPRTTPKPPPWSTAMSSLTTR